MMPCYVEVDAYSRLLQSPPPHWPAGTRRIVVSPSCTFEGLMFPFAG